MQFPSRPPRINRTAHKWRDMDHHGQCVRIKEQCHACRGGTPTVEKQSQPEPGPINAPRKRLLTILFGAAIDEGDTASGRSRLQRDVHMHMHSR